MFKNRKQWDLPSLCAPFEKGLRNFYILFSIVSSIIAIFTIEDWAASLRERLRNPESGLAKARPVTDMDYVWIIGVIVLFFGVLVVMAFCRYVWKKSCLIPVLVVSSILFWILDTVHPFLLVYADEPLFTEETKMLVILLQVTGHIMPGILFGFALTGWANLFLYCVEKIIKRTI